MQKSVQIDSKLFLQLYEYFKTAEDSSQTAADIFKQLDDKLDKLISRELFSQYKRAATPDEREQARQEYLDQKGIHKNWRTPHEVRKTEL